MDEDRARCVSAGAISGVVEGVGLGCCLWSNPYVGLLLVLGGWVLLIVAHKAAA